MEFYKIGSVLFLIFMSIIANALGGSYRPDHEAAVNEYRSKRDHHHQGITGPVHTFVKTDKHANFKWGVRHHVGHQYA